jgi:pimeloyl-ACP methyl ester carboxylesterase
MMKSPVTRGFSLAGMSLLMLLYSLPLGADTIREKLPSDRYGVAFYQQGDMQRPAVLVLHGFLTTHNFNTVMGISELLVDNGYTVLAPTMTLGINARQGGLSCDAIHTHTLEEDLEEITFWVNWLTRRSHQQIILIGHSSGSLELLAYLNDNPLAAVKKLIATSLVYADGFNPQALVKQQITEAQQRHRQGDRTLQTYTLSYCRDNFLAPPYVYLSYTAWTQQRVLAALKHSPVPVTIIMGGEDERFKDSWISGLQQTGAELIVIRGASHFFDSHHEFDLHDAILSLLEKS